MSDTQELEKLIQKIKALDKSPDSSTWSILQEELCEKIEAHIENYQVMQQTLDLGYQEMKKMLELFEQKDLLTKSIFDSSQDIILTLDENGQVIEFNRALETLLKIDRKTVMGNKLTSVLPNCSFTTDLENIFSKIKAVDSVLGKPYESSLYDTKGNQLIVLILIDKIQHRDRIIYPLYIKDLTTERNAAKELEESRAKLLLTSKMSALGEMAGGVAHEINTPLAVIQMRSDQLLECMADGSLDKETLSSALKAIDDTVKRITKIISGLRSFARDGRKDPMTLFSVSKIVEDTFSLCKERFSSHGVQLDYISKLDYEIPCRPGEISQVLLNMLNNAFDAIQSLPNKWVKVELEQVNSSISIKVTDSGLGIPQDIQKKMMQPFFTTKEIGKGTGLGLSISKGLVESHGGSLIIDNSSKNTCLVVSLPLVQQKKSQVA